MRGAAAAAGNGAEVALPPRERVAGATVYWLHAECHDAGSHKPPFPHLRSALPLVYWGSFSALCALRQPVASFE